MKRWRRRRGARRPRLRIAEIAVGKWVHPGMSQLDSSSKARCCSIRHFRMAEATARRITDAPRKNSRRHCLYSRIRYQGKMARTSFLIVKRREGDGCLYHVVHSSEPKFSIEVDPAYSPFGKPGCNFIKSIRLNNSWSGDYHRCFALVRKAEEFFRRSFEADFPDGETARRMRTR